ncbi:MAG: cytochrome c-type biogenesis protein CcmH [Geopsychrobacter sp.]|nr:cytochrome c-type biogenesis protein CcmH [Geopsychrobacter sp.]
MSHLISRYSLPLLLMFLLVLLTPAPGVAELTVTEVSESLICYACPGEALNIDRCSGGDQMRAAINQMLNQGKNKAEILDYFVAQFGDSILTTVPKKGFNLVAYLGPVLGLLIGIPLALWIIRRWGAAGRSQSVANTQAAEARPLDDEVRQQIEKELSKLDEED